MSNHVYRITEIVGSSPDSVEEAIRTAIRRSAQTVRNLDWFEISEVRGRIADGEVDQFQVTLRVGFRVEE